MHTDLENMEIDLTLADIDLIDDEFDNDLELIDKESPAFYINEQPVNIHF